MICASAAEEASPLFFSFSGSNRMTQIFRIGLSVVMLALSIAVSAPAYFARVQLSDYRAPLSESERKIRITGTVVAVSLMDVDLGIARPPCHDRFLFRVTKNEGDFHKGDYVVL